MAIYKNEIVARDTHTHSTKVVDLLSVGSPKQYRDKSGWQLPTICVTHGTSTEELDQYNTINSGTSQSVCIEMDQRVRVLRAIADRLRLNSDDLRELITQLTTDMLELKALEAHEEARS